jgi:hypothetical protein
MFHKEVIEDLIPTKLNIIGRDVNIELVEDLQDKLGECHVEDCLIKLQKGQQAQTGADTFLHECIHVIDERFQLNLTERQVYCTTVGLIALLKDNPSMLQYLAQALLNKRIV